MIKYFKTRRFKKRIAFEIILLTLTIIICYTIYAFGEYSKRENEILYSKINSLKEYSCENIYWELETDHINGDYYMNEYSQKAFNKRMLEDKDSAFRKFIYWRLCVYKSKYKNDISEDEFINLFDNTTYNKNNQQILNLKERIYNDDINEFLICLLLIIIYPLRIIYYLLKWALKTLKEKDIPNDNILNEGFIQINNDKPSKDEKPRNLSNYKKEISPLKKNQPEMEKKRSRIQLKKYITNSDEYITGNQYWLRTSLAAITVPLFGFGLYLMFLAAYKRCKSIGFDKIASKTYAIILIIISIISPFLTMFLLKTNSLDEVLLVDFLLCIPFVYLHLTNGTRK